MEMDSIYKKAVDAVSKSEYSLCRFIVANEVGKTGSHQSGFYLNKGTWPLYFSREPDRGNNYDKIVLIHWEGWKTTESRFIYYGKRTRDEYRLTRFGRGFPYLGDNNIGDLLVLAKIDEDNYHGFVLSKDEDIENFLETFNISPSDIGGLINSVAELPQYNTETCFTEFLDFLTQDFPSTFSMAERARFCFNTTKNITSRDITENPDKILLGWIDCEYDLFKFIERDRYKEYLTRPFDSLQALIDVANTILNRRKSRAGRSLEHHLSAIFDHYNLNFATQAKTENNKKPDFLFPDQSAYHDSSFDNSKIIFLAAKTTCKDRWRQILNEADRIPVKHLFTLQQGISSNQLQEMRNSRVKLVVPKNHVKFFPEDHRADLISLKEFSKKIENIQLT